MEKDTVIWYRVKSRCDFKIHNPVVLKETDKLITFIDEYGREFREAKESDRIKWFRVREDAINHLLTKYAKRVEDAERQLLYAQEQYDKVKEYIKQYASNDGR